MNSPRNVLLPHWYVNGFHGEFKPVISYSKPRTFSTLFGEEKNKMHLLSPIRQDHLTPLHQKNIIIIN